MSEGKLVLKAGVVRFMPDGAENRNEALMLVRGDGVLLVMNVRGDNGDDLILGGIEVGPLTMGVKDGKWNIVARLEPKKWLELMEEVESVWDEFVGKATVGVGGVGDDGKGVKEV